VKHPLIEIAVEGIDGLLAAEAGGADRGELCASLLEGGLTPSIGMVREAMRLVRMPFHVMVRPRGGDFLYSDAEFASMRADVQALRDASVPGVVFGCLTPNAEIDQDRMRELVRVAGPMKTVCHRAFDMTRDPAVALETLIGCGIGRVLSSGQRDTAEEGAALLGQLHIQAAGRIVVMGCGRLRADSIAAVQAVAKLDELHFASPDEVPSGMLWRNPNIGMGGTAIEREFLVSRTSAEDVRATIAAVR
jgi:copper homeostasis protein